MGLRTISDHILDIYQNAVDSGASKIELHINEESGKRFFFKITDNGKGIDKEKMSEILDPFYTEKEKAKKFGLGLPFLKQAAEATGGNFKLSSMSGQGTEVSATFVLSHIDCQPVGDLAQTLVTVIQMSGDTYWTIRREKDQSGYEFSRSDFIKILGNDFAINAVKIKMVQELISGAEKALL
ncbi:histidine kinase [Kosmotoga arenicorallina S304]|uniref:histidine kinase n=1 Tax=Kosmotoga arenicorallina S304 TaxID=1453497 RepID=A0A176K3M1_9BACT|nr:ATP-binding protein [Kosmotoga arenicorallina]OAA31915.1 histidine kinase [Kosmotoga arenicorallina S304]